MTTPRIETYDKILLLLAEIAAKRHMVSDDSRYGGLV